MPPGPWAGYGRFCPLARSLDVVGDRWTLVIVQELLKRPSRYSDLKDRLPGIGTSLLADRLRRLEAAGVLVREPGAVGEGVLYELTDRGRALEEPLRALREWGAQFLFDPTADGHADRHFDMAYVEGIENLRDGQFELVVDGQPTTLRFSEGQLHQEAGAAPAAELVVRTSSAFLGRWAAGDIDWDGGVAEGDVVVDGPAEAWRRWLAASGYELRYEPETTDARGA
jgi:DNA-binding HxlR family transcriptional regulator